ncbi:MAG: PadR family transcriptional regulator [Muribaculaceae bacterium]|nr:PadR family transcriptional regulator [Muribaculaceae bacterium]
MNVENIKSQMRKGVLEFCVLLILQHRPAYASELIASLKEANLIVVEGTLYPLLTRMKNSGLLAYNWVESTSGPPRKYYELTEVGCAALDALRSLFCDIAKSVEILSNTDMDKTITDVDNVDNK